MFLEISLESIILICFSILNDQSQHIPSLTNIMKQQNSVRGMWCQQLNILVHNIRAHIHIAADSQIIFI